MRVAKLTEFLHAPVSWSFREGEFVFWLVHGVLVGVRRFL